VKVTAVILVSLDLDDFAAGDPQTEAAADIVRTIAQTARHRLVAHGVRVGEVSAVLHSPDPTIPAP
jgi:hypothetical protein